MNTERLKEIENRKLDEGSHSSAKASKTIQTAAKWFLRLGFQIVDMGHCFSNGVDFTVIKNNRSYSVEVKPVRLTTGSWRVDPVTKDRKQDDLIALVFPSGVVHIESMKSHLALCSKNGARGMAVLGWLYE